VSSLIASGLLPVGCSVVSNDHTVRVKQGIELATLSCQAWDYAVVDQHAGGIGLKKDLDSAGSYASGAASIDSRWSAFSADLANLDHGSTDQTLAARISAACHHLENEPGYCVSQSPYTSG
jgi:hypothetical protein